MLGDVLIGSSYFDWFIEILRTGFPFFAGAAFFFVVLRFIFHAFFCEK